MNLSKVLFTISVSMFIFAVLFFVYALNHPEGFINIPIIGAKGLYLIYILVMIVLFVASKLVKKQ
ncbi:hypothetical protein [Sporosalibacterium faouarense]|uniref:hypothetical protein n=1 Tax=Sporosalibacterium faouarense TaxID=516123 RepID=UPI00141CBAAB|nr:hypothetical protein [Sporosalibacterium faouarense]MTI48739.1 hypothetical protein [Bacillota bacterium]